MWRAKDIRNALRFAKPIPLRKNDLIAPGYEVIRIEQITPSHPVRTAWRLWFYWPVKDFIRYMGNSK
ncbi:hypothetical protein UFOVP1165_58 [uncultured Caudovirales phage]|uniref:Uncharacterized protein n=1 Tax=uncultured Caudovirales phage TaxID=2100421 RepID=A0A6J5R619_9CAUD|nr:hypothetical protein UFOVP1165_58 [uncultured Caudovirales phage]